MPSSTCLGAQQSSLTISALMLSFLSIPWVDKCIAVLASLPASLEAYRFYRHWLMDLPRALFFAQAALFVVTMLIRRNPVRISANPWCWLVAFVSSNYALLTAASLRAGVRVAPAAFINALAVFGLWMSIFARFSLGRNIALVPAQREIVTGGMYRYIRHPIYSAYFVSATGWVLSSWSLVNALAIASGCAIFVVRTLMEESFLSQDPCYLAYMKRVRGRWLPWLV